MHSIIKAGLTAIMVVLTVHLYSQDRIDSLVNLLEEADLSENEYVSAVTELSLLVEKSEREYYLPFFAPSAINKATLLNDTLTKLNLLNHLGRYYWQTGRYSQSIEQYNHMRQICDSAHYPHLFLESLNGLGNVYYLTLQYDEAWKFYEEGLRQAGNDTVMRIKFGHNMANILSVREEFDQAIQLYNESISFDLEKENWRELSISYCNLALAYAQLDEKKLTSHNFVEALRYAHESKDPYQIAHVMRSQAEAILERHPERAIKYVEKSLSWARQGKVYQQILDNLTLLAFLHQEKDEFRASSRYYEEAYDLLDSLQKELQLFQIEASELRYKTNQLEREQTQIKQNQELLRITRISRLRWATILLTIGILSLGLFSLLLYRGYRLRIQVNRTRNRLFSIVAHDLRNPLNGVVGLSEVLLDAAGQDTGQKNLQRLQAMHQSAIRIRELADNLLDWSLSESKRVQFFPGTGDLQQTAENSIMVYSHLIADKQLKAENLIPAATFAHYDDRMIQAVFRNLISNAIKFSHPGGSIRLSARRSGEDIEVTVQDQGVGMTDEQIRNFMKRGKGQSGNGTLKESGSGLGLGICKKFIARHGGKLRYEANPEGGTRFIFSLSPAR